MPALVPRVTLAPGYTIPRLVKGGWQLAGGHGPVDRAAALDDMRAFVGRPLGGEPGHASEEHGERRQGAGGAAAKREPRLGGT